MTESRPFDAVLLIAFGGPQGIDDIRSFLQHVLRGRRIPPARVEEVAHHYELFQGVSPIAELTRRQAAGLAKHLAARNLDVPVHVGMRNWHPFLADTLATLSRTGVRRALGFIMAAHGSYSSCQQYRQNVVDARAEIAGRGARDVEVVYVGSWFDHPQFIAAVAQHVRDARLRLPAAVREQARLVFTAHSIPQSMATACRYEAQLRESCTLVARGLGTTDWAMVFQSRSGRSEDLWLAPDVCDYLRAEHARGLAAVILCPIGFVADHVEVLYDLDREAAGVCRALQLPMTRAEALNDDPLFLDMMADVVQTAFDRYAHARPLPVAPVP